VFDGELSLKGELLDVEIVDAKQMTLFARPVSRRWWLRPLRRSRRARRPTTRLAHTGRRAMTTTGPSDTAAADPAGLPHGGVRRRARVRRPDVAPAAGEVPNAPAAARLGGDRRPPRALWCFYSALPLLYALPLLTAAGETPNGATGCRCSPRTRSRSALGLALWASRPRLAGGCSRTCRRWAARPIGGAAGAAGVGGRRAGGLLLGGRRDLRRLRAPYLRTRSSPRTSSGRSSRGVTAST
jgi:hypothetical protein